MNERVVPKMTNFCVVKLSNSPAITCVPRLELDHFESQPDSLRNDQRLPSSKGVIRGSGVSTSIANIPRNQGSDGLRIVQE